MPLYTFRCPSCKGTEDVFLGVARRDGKPVYHVHGGHRVRLVREVSPVAGIVRNPAVPRRARG
jgi:hypothetical protein